MKKGVFILFLVICVLFALSSVCASDVNDTIVVNDDNQMELSQDVMDDNLKSNEIDEIITASPKTFGDLNTAVNGNNDSDVYLDDNYKFELGSDAAFKDGVVIDRAVTVHGNGFTLDGDNAARIFKVTESGVVFKDIVFVNGKTSGDGGAVNGQCSVLNCIFINNGANYGGAVSGVTAIGCTFIDNFATQQGGATNYGSAMNCSFIGNSARVAGGAVNGGTIIGCNFTNNHAETGAGAQLFGTAVNCTFNSNTAGSYGGAVSSVDAENCIFINNTAYNGGAMYGNGYTATNCQFINNTARNGGATYQITANNCEFTENTAAEYGGAMYGGTAVSSNFINNDANGDGGAVYDILVANCLFECNSAENGGAMSRGRAVNCTFKNNNATNYGGAVYNAKISNDSKFYNNIALNGTETDNVTWFDPANSKSFFDLNELINNNTDADIYLNGNYTFDLRKDADFKNGVVIDRVVTVHGNGFTLDGDNAARIFKVTESGVVFKDIVFVNGKTSGDGGAVNGQCSVLNCTFINNGANYGGAVSGVAAIDCKFIDNFATQQGGATNYGSAINCSFIGNGASVAGGAVNGGTIICCNFTNNHAETGAGAQLFGTAVNCTFNSNAAGSYGGAVSSVDAENCIFINNTAQNGGAMYGNGYTATNCQFINNTARNGGATYKITANYCNFTNNAATENGGAMYGGTAVSSNFINNNANEDGGAVYDILVANCLFECNSAENGGAMSRGRAVNCTFNNNNATNYGGAVYDAQVSTDSIFYNNIALNGNATDNVTWFAPVNSKSLFDLNELINNNTDADIYLNDNYTFVLMRDADFKDGVVISRAVTVHGNGFTLDGDNAARIFKVTESGVVFKDIVFVNGKTSGDGGAINGQCSVLNCTFINNGANYGGAVSGVAAVNCTFIDNFATQQGGATNYGSAINCSFIGNGASVAGGAVNGGTIINCNFTNNHAETGAGAQLFGTAVNCTFNSNAAGSYGGAVSSVDAENCIFINNTAQNGGAMHGNGYTATNCQFINNTAKNGGATYKITANNCKFTENTATENGGAMYEGIANNCIFKDNKAGISGDNTYNTIVPKPVFSVSNFTSTYNSGDKLLFSFTTASGIPISNANITIRVYKNNALVGTYYALSGDGWVVESDAGSYIAVCSVENQAYDVEPANATLTISKADTKVTSSAVSAVYNNNKNLVVTLKDSQGRPISNVEVSINVGGVKKLTTDKNGQVKLNIANMVPKTYTAKITFNGNDNYKASSASVKVTVNKAKPAITAKAKTFKKAKKVKKYSITLKSGKTPIKNAHVAIKINKKTYAAKTNKKGVATFKIKKLTKKGTYKATVTYKGNAYYNKVTKKVKIKIK